MKSNTITGWILRVCSLLICLKLATSCQSDDPNPVITIETDAKAYSFFDNKTEMYTTYGALYSCAAARYEEGGMLKQTGTELWVEPNLFATNETGFTAIPAGFRDVDGPFRVETNEFSVRCVKDR